MKINKNMLNENVSLIEADNAEEAAEDRVEKSTEQAEVAEKKIFNFNIKDLEGRLNHMLRKNIAQLKKGHKQQILNLLVVGPAGVGKSGIISDWAKQAGINLVTITGAQLTNDLVQGVPFRVENYTDDYEGLKKQVEEHPDDKEAAERLKNCKKELHTKLITIDFFKKLDKPNSVLFIDELNRSNDNVRAAVLDLIQSHNIPDSNQDTNSYFSENYLFTVAAINPADSTHRGAKPLDLAMLTRFSKFDWKPSVSVTRKYLEKGFKEAISICENDIKNGNTEAGIERLHGLDKAFYTSPQESLKEYKGRLNLLNALLQDPAISFSYDEAILANAQETQSGVLNARTLTSLLLDCDGTKEQFIDLWPSYCGTDLLNAAKVAVSNVEDIPDEMGQALDVAGLADKELKAKLDAKYNQKSVKSKLMAGQAKFSGI